MPYFGRSAAAICVVAAMMLSACQSAPRLVSNQGLQIIKDLPSSDAVTADDMYSEANIEAEYTVIAGEDAGSARRFVRSTTSKFGATIQDEIVGVRSEFLRLDAQGNVVMCAVIDRANSALSLFDPPLVVMPATLARNKPFEARAAMRVVDVKNPSKQKEHGSAIRTIEYIGDRLVKTTFGEVECHLLTIVFTADLSLADDVTKTTLYVSPKYGVVAEQWSERLKVFGAITSERGQVSLLASEPK